MRMGEFTQFLWAMVDSTHAALIGLNLAPLIVFSLFIGMVTKRRLTWLKAALAIIPAVIVSALWPMIYGADAIWPDVSQIETGIQAVVLYAVALAVIVGVGLIKRWLASAEMHRPVIIPVISEG